MITVRVSPYFPIRAGCSIRTLEGDLIRYQEIRFLDLEHNDLQGEQADLHVLHSLPNLVTLNLQYNRIQALDDFSPNKNLQLLELDNNEIQSLAGFKHPTLFALTMSKNNISGFKGGHAHVTLSSYRRVPQFFLLAFAGVLVIARLNVFLMSSR